MLNVSSSMEIDTINDNPSYDLLPSLFLSLRSNHYWVSWLFWLTLFLILGDALGGKRWKSKLKNQNEKPGINDETTELFDY